MTVRAFTRPLGLGCSQLSVIQKHFAIVSNRRPKIICANPSFHQLTGSPPFELRIAKATSRGFNTAARMTEELKMSDLNIELTAPNGRKYMQPTGLFINNEWVKSKSGEKISSVNPR